MFDPTKMMPGGQPNFAAIIAAKKAAKEGGSAPAEAPAPENMPTRARGASTPAEAATSADNMEIMPIKREQPKMGFGMMLPAKKGPAATPAEAATGAPATPKKEDDEEKEESTPQSGITHVKKAKMARGARRAPIQKVWVNPNAGRENVVKECVWGEALYSQLLHETVTKFAQPLTAAPQKYGLTPQQVTILTKGLLEIDKFHLRFSKDMMEQQRVPAVILEKKDDLTRMYRAYVDDYVNILSLLNELRGSPRWLAHIKSLREAKPPFYVEDSYLMAMQRMAVYELLLRKLSQSTSDDHGEYKSLQEAMEVVRQVAVYGAEKGRQAENATAVITLQNKLELYPSWFKLYKPDRRIIRKGVLVKSKSGRGAGHERLVFLMNDLLIWVTPDTFHYKGHVGLEYVTTADLDIETSETKTSGKLGLVINLRGLTMSDDDEKAGKIAKGTSTVPRNSTKGAAQPKKGGSSKPSAAPAAVTVVAAKQAPVAAAPAKVVVVPAAAPPKVEPPHVPAGEPPAQKKSDATKPAAAAAATTEDATAATEKRASEKRTSVARKSDATPAVTTTPATDADKKEDGDNKASEGTDATGDDAKDDETKAKEAADKNEEAAAKKAKEEADAKAKEETEAKERAEQAERDAKAAADAKERKAAEDAALKAEEDAKAKSRKSADKEKLIADSASSDDVKLHESHVDEVAMINGVPINSLPVSASWVFVADTPTTQELWKKDIDAAVIAWLKLRREHGLEDEEGELGGTGAAEPSSGCCVIS